MPSDPSLYKKELRHFLTGSIPFVLDRKKVTGGYGAAPSLPPTVDDTYYAMGILNLVRRFSAEGEYTTNLLHDTNLHSYLNSCRRKYMDAGSKTVFRLLSTCRFIGIEPDPHVIKLTVQKRLKVSCSLEDWYYGARTLTEVLGDKYMMELDPMKSKPVLENAPKTVDETWMQLYLYRTMHNTLPKPPGELIKWYQDCQNGDGGFGFSPRTTSFAENCHTSLKALHSLAAVPLRTDLAFSYLSYCRTTSGGFGRSLRAAPFLDATWNVLSAMAIIADMNFS